ncbi:MAG: TonB family protein [Opitutaceae bacterium]
MIEDAELLRRYAEEKAEPAFAELVRRHVDFVYACAQRRVGGDVHLAEDVTQQVFTALAQGAAGLSRRPVLAGWLFTTTRFAAAQVVRTERRRHAREQEAHTMNEILADDGRPDADWEKLRPLLDDALDHISEHDREAVLLRFSQQESFAALGEKLGLSENAARMRVDRALDKLHGLLAQRGVSSTTAALAVALTGQTVAAPASLAVSVTASALAATGAGTGATATMIFMGMNKLQIGLGGALVALTATGIAFQPDDGPELQNEIAALNARNQELATVVENNRELTRAAAATAGLRADAAALPALQQEAERLKAELMALERVSTRASAAAPSPTVLAPVVSGPVLDISELDGIPQVKYRTDVQYPFEMRRLGLDGQVVVEFVVDQDGNVNGAFAVRSSQSDFEVNAVSAVSKWKFKPGVKAAQNVNTRMQVPIVFTLGSGDNIPPLRKNLDWF